MHFQYTVFGPLDEFHGFIQICYYECPHISGIYLESLLIPDYCLSIYFAYNSNTLSFFGEYFVIVVIPVYLRLYFLSKTY